MDDINPYDDVTEDEDELDEDLGSEVEEDEEEFY